MKIDCFWDGGLNDYYILISFGLHIVESHFLSHEQGNEGNDYYEGIRDHHIMPKMWHIGMIIGLK